MAPSIIKTLSIGPVCRAPINLGVTVASSVLSPLWSAPSLVRLSRFLLRTVRMAPPTRLDRLARPRVLRTRLRMQSMWPCIRTPSTLPVPQPSSLLIPATVTSIVSSIILISAISTTVPKTAWKTGSFAPPCWVVLALPRSCSTVTILPF